MTQLEGTSQFKERIASGVLETVPVCVLFMVASLLSSCSSIKLVDDEVITRSDTLVNVLRNDPSARLTLDAVSQPEHGTTKIVSDSVVKIVPDGNYHGIDSFEYTVVDSAKGKCDAEVRVVVLPPTIKEAVITVVSGAKDSSEVYQMAMMRGSELLWEKVKGKGEKWENGHRSADTVRFASKDEISYENIDDGRLIISKDPFTNPNPSPLVEVIARLSNEKRIVVLPRTSKPDSSYIEASTWEWRMKKDPFGPRRDEGDKFGKGDTVYGLTIGASFDFLNKLQLDNVYSSINVFAPSLWNVCGPIKVGLDAGFFQNRSIASSSESEESDLYRVADMVGVISKYSHEKTNKIDNFGAFVNPTVKLTNGLYAFLNLEVRGRSITETSKYSKVSSDTLRISATDSLYARFPNSKFANPTSKMTTLYDLLLGPGLFASFENHAICFEISVFGSSNLKGELNAIFQFDLHVKKSDLILGGEVRDRRAFKGDSSKEIVIYLAKYLPITALSDFFTGQ